MMEDFGKMFPKASRTPALKFRQNENGPVGTRMIKPIHTDRRFNLQVESTRHKWKPGKHTGCPWPTDSSVAQLFHCTCTEIHSWNAWDRKRRARPEALGSTDVISSRDLEWDSLHLNARKATSFISSSRTSLSCSSTQISLSCSGTLSANDGIKRQLHGAISKELLKDLEEGDFKDDNELLGSMIHNASKGFPGSNGHGVAACSAKETRLFCSTLREGARNNDEEGDRENEDVLDVDSDNETDLEENFFRRKPKHDLTGREVYETECKKNGIIPSSFLLARFICPKLLMPHHGLGPSGGKALAKALMVNTHIKTLHLSDNNLRSIGGTSMAYMLHHNYCISDLDLSENRLDMSAGVAIAKAMVINETVRRLVLRETLKENRKLCELDLSYNNFGEHGGLYLGAGLSLNYGLKVLKLKWNIIRGKGAVAIAHALAKNETLQSLNLSWNGFSYMGALALSTNLFKNEELKHLDLRNNHLGGDAILRLALAFAQHKNIQKIKLGQNPISQEGVVAIFDAVARNPRIRHVGLENISVPVKLVPLVEKLRMVRDVEIKVDIKPKSTATEKQLDNLIESIDWNENKRVDYREILRGHRNARLDKTRQAKALLEIRKKEQEALLLPEMDIIKRDLCSKRR